MIHFFPNLRKDEVQNLAPELTVFLFSFGGLEQHGPHLPIGTKWFLADQAIRALAENLNSKMPQWNFVLMPTLPLVIDPYTTKFSFPVRAHVLRDYLVDQCEALKRHGFLKFAAFSAHVSPRQLSAIEEAGKIISKRKIPFKGEKALLVSVSSQEVNSSEVFRSPMIALPKEHGGVLDTSAMLKLKPDLVAKDFISLPAVAPQKQNFSRLISYYKKTLDGYWGKPAEASLIENHSQEEKIEKAAVMLKAVFETGQGGSLFNSGYRFYFFNGSFFAAYLLAAMFFIMMLVWTLWSLKDVFEP